MGIVVATIQIATSNPLCDCSILDL